MLAGCEMGGGTDPNDITGIDYTNYTTDYSVRIKNDSSVDLVVFKGTVSKSTLMGGVKAQEANHGMKKDSALFSTTGDFPLVFITEDQYKKNKDNLDVLNQSPYARVYAFYNKDGENDTLYEVSGSFGGGNTLVINNPTTYIVELRQNGIHGAPLGFARDETVDQRFYLTTGDFILYPVFKLYINQNGKDMIKSIYPRYSDGYAKTIEFSLGKTSQERQYLVDVSEFMDELGEASMSTGAAYLVITNNSNMGVRLFKGGNYVTNPANVATINNGTYETFQIDMPSPAPGVSVSEIAIDSYTVGGMSTPQAKRASIVPPDNGNLQIDTIYNVNITSDGQGGFIATCTKGGSISLEDFIVEQD
jgi:hypothetical protein